MRVASKMGQRAMARLRRSVRSCSAWSGKLELGIDKPRVGITVGDPAGIGPEIAVKAAAAPGRARRLRTGALRARRRRRSWRRSIAGAVSAERREDRLRRDPRAVADAQAGPHRRRGDGTDQQGSVRRGRRALAGAHGAPRASHRRLALRDDVLRRRAARRPRDRPHPAVGGAARRSRASCSTAIDRADGRRAAALRPSAAEAGGRGPEPARRRARRHRQGRGRGDAAGD